MGILSTLHSLILTHPAQGKTGLSETGRNMQGDFLFLRLILHACDTIIRGR